MITEEQYRKLKREVEDAKSEADRAEGALAQLLKRLEEEFQCSNLREAKAMLTNFEAKEEKAKEAFDKSLKAYEERWKQ